MLTEAVGGKFFDLANDKSGMSFQPLADIDDQRERSWVLDWLCDYIAEQNMQITPEIKRFIREALESLATQPKEYRLMQTLVSTIQNKPIKEALKSLTLEGEYEQIFDARSDELEFSSWQAFEIEKLMDSKRIVGPTLMYIFHRIQNELERNPDRPSIIVLDEEWIYFDNPQYCVAAVMLGTPPMMMFCAIHSAGFTYLITEITTAMDAFYFFIFVVKQVMSLRFMA